MFFLFHFDRVINYRQLKTTQWVERRGNRGKRAIWISIATLQAFNNRINVAPGAAVPDGKGSIGKKAKPY